MSSDTTNDTTPLAAMDEFLAQNKDIVDALELFEMSQEQYALALSALEPSLVAWSSSSSNAAAYAVTE